MVIPAADCWWSSDGEDDDGCLLKEAKDDVGHLPHPLDRRQGRATELHGDGEPRGGLLLPVLHLLFSRFGRVACVTILKDCDSHRSQGVAFVLFVRRADAAAAAAKMHGKVLNGRTLSASIAANNGRAAEFIRSHDYHLKPRCYECGEEGHLSYECPRNQLGPARGLRPPRSRAAVEVAVAGADEGRG